jgi:hypothetical protein
MAFEEFSGTAGDLVDAICCTLHQLLHPKQYVTWLSYLGMLVLEVCSVIVLSK